MTTPSDENLVSASRSGDPNAFQYLVRRWQRKVYSLAYRTTGSADEAEEVRQVAFLRAYRGLASFNGQAAFSTWMYRIVLNLCRDQLRSRQVRARCAEAETAAGAEPYSAGAEGSVGESLEIGRQVADAVLALPPAEREVVVLRHYQGLSFREVAQVLDTPVTTAKSRMARALGTLRRRLGDLKP